MKHFRAAHLPPNAANEITGKRELHEQEQLLGDWKGK